MIKFQSDTLINVLTNFDFKCAFLDHVLDYLCLKMEMFNHTSTNTLKLKLKDRCSVITMLNTPNILFLLNHLSYSASVSRIPKLKKNQMGMTLMKTIFFKLPQAEHLILNIFGINIQ